MTTIFTSFVWHRNYPGSIHIINLLLAPAVHSSTEARGRHIKNPGHAHIKYADCPSNEYENTFSAMVLLLNTSRDNNGCGALYAHVIMEGGHDRARSPCFFFFFAKEKEKGTVPTHF